MDYIVYWGVLLAYASFVILCYLLLISVVVGVHEFGHYQMARWCNIKITDFSIGFGKVLFQRVITKDKTTFTFRILPLGGFVKPLDKATVSQEDWDKLSDSEKARAYNNANRGKKVLMLFGGPLINFVLAFVLYLCAMVMIGSPKYPPVVASIAQNTVLYDSGLRDGDLILKINGEDYDNSTDAFKEIISVVIKGGKLDLVTDKGSYSADFANQDLSKYGRSIDRAIGVYFVGPKSEFMIENVVENSAAEKAGLRAGDFLKEVNGKEVISTAWARNQMSSSLGKDVTLKISRDNKDFVLSFIPDEIEEFGEKKAFVGVLMKPVNVQALAPERESFFNAIPKSISMVGDDIKNTANAIKKLFNGELSTKNISGPAAMIEFSGKAASSGIYPYLNLMALISVGIGLFNLLPLPMLDGGQIVVNTIEAIRRKNFSDNIHRKIQIAGFFMMFGFFIFVMIQDIRNMF